MVGPDTPNIPAANIVFDGNDVAVELSSVIAELSAAKKKNVSNMLRSKYGLTREEATKALARIIPTYVVTYVEQSQVAALTQDSQQVSIMAARSKTVRDRRNRISLRGLTPGGAYSASWRVEISLKNPRVVLGKTKSSVNTNFTAPRG